MDEIIERLNKLIAEWETLETSSSYSPGIEIGYREAASDLRIVVKEYSKVKNG
jgi:hypothetical protein